MPTPKERQGNNCQISRRYLVCSQGRKTEFGGPNEAFSDAGCGREIKPKAKVIDLAFLSLLKGHGSPTLLGTEMQLTPAYFQG